MHPEHVVARAAALVAALVALGAEGTGQDCMVPTSPHPLAATLVDGTRIQVWFRGNGFEHWYEDVDGRRVIRTDAGWAHSRLSGEDRFEPTSAGGTTARMRGRGPARGASPQGSAAIVGGSVDNLVLLLRFADHGPGGQDRTLPSAADVSVIMNAVGGDPTLAPTGSVRDYYLEASYGAMTIDSTVVGWLDVGGTEPYYANGASGASPLTWDLITEGLELADGLVDFTDFDGDSDGLIDMITVIHSGYAAEWGGDDVYGTSWIDRIWSHKWTIPTWTSDEGVQVADYNVSPGLWGLSGSDPGRIGVVCHELGHFLGLPDLYDTDGSSVGAGNWDLMAYGSWGFDDSQQYPSHVSAWCKLKLGWVTATTILPGSHSAPQVETAPQVLMIESGYPPGEYLLVENRQPLGFDAQLPQGGLVVWHVDEGKGSFSFNDQNQDEGFPGQPGWPENDEHYRLALLQADGDFDLELWSDLGGSGDPYHSGGAPLLDWLTTPDTNAYRDGVIVVGENRLSAIGASSANVPFTYQNTAAPLLVPISPPNAFVGLPYSQPILATGGEPPLTWTEYVPGPSYTVTDLGPQPFVEDGIPLGLSADEGTLTVALPFLFPWYETSYAAVQVTTNGCIDLAPLENEPLNTTGFLRSLPRIAGLWDDLTTSGSPGQDVYQAVGPGFVRFRWAAETVASAAPVAFAITLHADGRIRLDYGPGNTTLTPTVGMSRGRGDALEVIVSHDGESTLTDASSLELQRVGSQLPPGLSLTPDGFLVGFPSMAGVHEFHVRVTDAEHRFHQQLTSILVRSVTVGPGLPLTQKANPAPHSIRLP